MTFSSHLEYRTFSSLTRLFCVVALLVLPLLNCDCEEDVQAVSGKILVSPESIDMGDSYVGRLNLATFEVSNVGTALLLLKSVEVLPLENPSSDVDWADTTGAAFSVMEFSKEIKVDEVLPVSIGFTPPTQGYFGATLVFKSDDDETAEYKVQILGAGGKPSIVANPASVDFGVVNEGPGLSRIVLLTNTGFDALNISDLKIEGFDAAGNAIDSLAFSLGDEAANEAVVNAGESYQAEVFMFPTADAVAAAASDVLEARLKVVSDAENMPALYVPLQGKANLAPVPIVVELLTRLQEVKVSLGKEVTLDGNETYDPEGEDISFIWTLQNRPENSNAFLLSGPQGDVCSTDADCSTEDGYRCIASSSSPPSSRCKQVARTRVTPDVVGSYAVRLRATDARGAWAEADAIILPRDFAIVLTWSTASDAACQQISAETCAALSSAERRLQCCGQTDLDLHLLRPEALLGDYGMCPVGCTVENVDLCFEDSDENQNSCRQEGGDCSFANRYPEWGEAGRYDDPRLDIDDIRGEGPEVITLNNPPAGAYQAIVHFCTDRITEPTMATLDVYVKGELMHTAGPQRIDVEGSAWIAANLLRTGEGEDGQWTFVSVPNLFDESSSVAVCDP